MDSLYLFTVSILIKKEESLLERGRKLSFGYLVTLMDGIGVVDTINIDEKDDELAWGLFHELSGRKKYKIHDNMYLLWEE